MNILKKMKEKGLRHCFNSAFRIVSYTITDSINNLMFTIARSLFPVKNNRIVLESEGDYSDNGQALYFYMQKHGYLDLYEVIWLASNPSDLKKRYGLKACTKQTSSIHWTTNYYLATCKYYIYDHNNRFERIRKRKEQYILYLSHGFGYKTAKGYDGSKVKTWFDKIVATGNIPAEGSTRFWGFGVDKAVTLGYPRMDYFFSDLSSVRKTINRAYHFSDFTSVILWMPTFRKSNKRELSEEYMTNETGLPLFNTKQELNEFNTFLKQNHILFILKLHHLQADLPIFQSRFSNLLIIKDEELSAKKIQLYQFIALTDALVTDYSSVSVDYMLLNRPIIYTLDDYEEYNKSRGIWPENAIDFMIGYHVYTIGEIKRAILEISSGADIYQKKRNQEIGRFHTYRDGNSSKRILDYLGIKK